MPAPSPTTQVLYSKLDHESADYQAKRMAMAEAVGLLDAEQAVALAGGGERYVARHRSRGKLLARERIEMLVDVGSPFLELSVLAAWGTDYGLGGSVVTGLALVSGVRCVVIAHDPTVRGGTSNPYTWKKVLRAMDISREGCLPLVNLVESGGGDLRTQGEAFIPAGRLFHDLTELSARGVPTVALVFGNSTAGGAYVPGMCDYVVMVQRAAKVFLGGPPLVKMATGEESGEEELGGAEMHSMVSGLSDYLAADEQDCIRIGREIVAHFAGLPAGHASGSVHGQWQAVIEPFYEPDDLLGIAPIRSGDHAGASARDILARVLDGSRFDEHAPSRAPGLAAGWGEVHGRHVGILAGGSLGPSIRRAEAKKASELVTLSNRMGAPLVVIQSGSGCMAEALESCETSYVVIEVPSEGLPTSRMLRPRQRPERFVFSWPDPGRLPGGGRDRLFGGTSRVEDDGVIDPRDTRSVLAVVLSFMSPHGGS